VFALCSWVVVAFLPLAMPVGSRALLALVWVLIVSHMAHSGLLALVPGLGMLFGPAIGTTVFGIAMNGRVSPAHAISALAQVLVAVLCFVGAVRKYRRDDVLAWGPVMGLVVVAAYGLISLTGISLWEQFRTLNSRSEIAPFDAQLIIATIGALLAAALPVSAAAWLQTLWQRRKRLHDPAPNPRPIPVLLIATLAAIMVAALPWLTVQCRWFVVHHWTDGSLPFRRMETPSVRPDVSYDLLFRTALIAFAFLASVSYVFRVMYRRQARARWILGLFLALTCLGPLAIDLLINGASTQFDHWEGFTALSGCSPLVALIYLWSPAAEPIGTTLGIAVQLLIAAGLAIAYHSLAKKQGGPADESTRETLPIQNLESKQPKI
jgi:hypothetical protein